eukprot:gb/GEZN01006959.1/.p1 GENE.gb/GEZN01006959.1/~~gb/GEZN01006959.1/.p1  ORF type:complete len:497 (-),score=42.04 gb/GEZN01006959.1/:67-1557(-)
MLQILLYPCNLVGFVRIYLLYLAFNVSLFQGAASSPVSGGVFCWRLGFLCLAWGLDAVDGWLARRFGHVTRFGGVLDGMIDNMQHSLNVLTAFGFSSPVARAVVTLEGGVALALFGLKRSFQEDPILRVYFSHNQRNPFSAYSNLGRFALPLVWTLASTQPAIAGKPVWLFLFIFFGGGFAIYVSTTMMMAISMAGSEWRLAYLLCTGLLSLVSGRRAICANLLSAVMTMLSLEQSDRGPRSLLFKVCLYGSWCFLYVGVGGLLASVLSAPDARWVTWGSDFESDFYQTLRSGVPSGLIEFVYLLFQPLVFVCACCCPDTKIISRTYVVCCTLWLFYPVLGPVGAGQVKPVYESSLASSGTAFPSSHCAVSFACARALLLYWRSGRIKVPDRQPASETMSVPKGNQASAVARTHATSQSLKVRSAEDWKSSPDWLGYVVQGVFVLASAIAVSTVLTRQHYLLDTVTGVLLPWLLPAGPTVVNTSGRSDPLSKQKLY